MKRVPTADPPLDLDFGPTTFNLSMQASGVTPGSYTSANITVDPFGLITAAASGSGGGGLTVVAVGTVAGSAATTISLSGLDLSTDGPYFIDFAFENATAGASDISFYYSGDTVAANYYRRSFNLSGATGTAPGTSLAQNAVAVGVPASEAATGQGWLMLDRRGYARLQLSNSQVYPGVCWQVFNQLHVTAGNVTTLDCTASVANSLAVGSYIRIWKLT